MELNAGLHHEGRKKTNLVSPYNLQTVTKLFDIALGQQTHTK